MELPLPPVARIFAPSQNEGLPMIAYYLHEGAAGYRILNARRILRALGISSDVFLAIPITPLAPSPATSKQSHHIVRVFTLDLRYAVDFLFRDRDVYWIAFRRVIDGQVGTWFKFDNETIMPAGVHAVNIGLKNHHEGRFTTTLGGIHSLHGSLMTLVTFQQAVAEGRRPGMEMRRAKARGIVTFSEGLRFWCVEAEAAERMENNADATILSGMIWHRMQSWQVICDFLLNLRRRYALAANHPEYQQPDQALLANILAHYNYTNLNEIIGPQGDIRLILSRESFMILSSAVAAAAALPGAGNFQEPGFPDPQ